LIPIRVHFDRYAFMTKGLEAETMMLEITPSGMALCTEWLTGDPWMLCYQDPSTSWNECFSAPSTDWDECYSTPTTTWETCET